ncbi:hypothetical protein LA76x_0972 [Lysobacter antibioticus]|uniref:Uncharacterized protein n=1 Tax=Lysobacter antibioticus TaxID=84531 RepID=A0A0S2F6R3_LYSAN|nr:hypothetical protein LA76x_0972 [Lysobacter antibioticus]
MAGLGGLTARPDRSRRRRRCRRLRRFGRACTTPRRRTPVGSSRTPTETNRRR